MEEKALRISEERRSLWGRGTKPGPILSLRAVTRQPLAFSTAAGSHFPALIAKEIDAQLSPAVNPRALATLPRLPLRARPLPPLSAPAAIASCPRRSVGGAFVLRRAGGLRWRRQGRA